jgi:hypothetical protein
MKKTLILALLIFLVILSLFTGISINNNFVFLYDYTFVAIPKLIFQNYHGEVERLSIFRYIHWILLLLAHIGVISLPFFYLTLRKKFKKLLVYLPLIFLVLQFFVLAVFEFILIPFAIVWLIALKISRD